MQQHLIDFAVAIAANRNDPIMQAIQELRYLGWGIPLGHRISRPMIEKVAQQQIIIRREVLSVMQRLLKAWQTAMNV